MSELQPHQQRVIEEKHALDEKLTKLHAFCGGPVFAQLAPEDRALLFEQRSLMTLYSAVLERRIARFT